MNRSLVPRLVFCAAMAATEAHSSPTTGVPVAVVEMHTELLRVVRLAVYPDGTVLGATSDDVEAALSTHRPVVLRTGRLVSGELPELMEQLRDSLASGPKRYRLAKASHLPHFIVSDKTTVDHMADIAGQVEGPGTWFNKLILPTNLRRVLDRLLNVTFDRVWRPDTFLFQFSRWKQKEAAPDCILKERVDIESEAEGVLLMRAGEVDARRLLPYLQRCTFVGISGKTWLYAGYGPVLPGWRPFLDSATR